MLGGMELVILVVVIGVLIFGAAKILAGDVLYSKAYHTISSKSLIIIISSGFASLTPSRIFCT